MSKIIHNLDKFVNHRWTILTTNLLWPACVIALLIIIGVWSYE